MRPPRCSLVVAAVSVLFLLGVAFDMYDRFEPLFTRLESGDELIGLLILALAGVAVDRGPSCPQRAGADRTTPDRGRAPGRADRGVPRRLVQLGSGRAPLPVREPADRPPVRLSEEEHEADWATQIHPDDASGSARPPRLADRDGNDLPRRVPDRSTRRRGALDPRRVPLPPSRPDGRPTLAQGVMYDITERVEAEARATDAEERYRTLVERVPAIAYSWDTASPPDGTGRLHQSADRTLSACTRRGLARRPDGVGRSACTPTTSIASPPRWDAATRPASPSPRSTGCGRADGAWLLGAGRGEPGRPRCLTARRCTRA